MLSFLLFSAPLQDWQAGAKALTFSSWMCSSVSLQREVLSFSSSNCLLLLCSTTVNPGYSELIYAWRTHVNTLVNFSISMAFTTGASTELQKKIQGHFFTASYQHWEAKARCLWDLAVLLPSISSERCVFSAPYPVLWILVNNIFTCRIKILH